jgi:hypothetical protein
MSAVQRLPMVAGTLTFGASLAAILGVPSLRNRFIDLLGRGTTGNVLKLLAVAYALLNLKNLPFVWHVRCSLPIPNQLNLTNTSCPVPRLQRPHLSNLPTTPAPLPPRPLPPHDHLLLQLSLRLRLQPAQEQQHVLLGSRRRACALHGQRYSYWIAAP